MRDPVFCAEFPEKYRCSYERETIELWLKTRGGDLSMSGPFVIGGSRTGPQLRNEMGALSSTKDDGGGGPL